MALIVSCILFFSLPAFAEVYKWVDDQGRVHFSDKQPGEKQVESLTLQPNLYTHQNASLSTPPSDKVIMYSTAWCGYCKKARKYFSDNNIPFVEYDIEKNPRARREYDKIGGKGVPVIVYQNKHMNGFSEANFNRFYKRK
ncbi:MAG: glutaredoxin family protein [Cellvibrionales bacterium]|nr:glutaredoxin family protein [Cellvibrionales bacterium]